MFIIHCPHCGACDAGEFSYGGDASRTSPALDAAQEVWFEHVYLRSNPRGEHEEFWQHVHGCRQWLRVRRNTLTHTISASGPASQALPADADEETGERA